MKVKASAVVLAFVFALSSCSVVIRSEETEPSEDVSYNPSREELEQTNIPVLYLTTEDGKKINSKQAWKSAAFNLLGEYCGYTDLTLEAVQVKGRGNTSWALPKKSYSIKLEEKTKVLGMKKSKRWVLLANYSDKTLLKNYYASYLGNELYDSVWNPSFVPVHLVVNDQYRGVYLLGEQIKLESNRVNITDISKTTEQDGSDGGFIFEVNCWHDEPFNFRTEKKVSFSLKDPDEVSEEIQATVQTIVQRAENVLYSRNFTDEQNGWRAYFDEQSVIDWYMVNEITKNKDANFNTSVYMYYDASDAKIHFGPNWDFDISCGGIRAGGCDESDGFYIKKAAWISRMFEDPVFVQNVKRTWNEKKDELRNSIDVWIPAQAALLHDAADCNFNRWLVFGCQIWPFVEGAETRHTYESEVAYLTQWLSERYQFLNAAINAL
ncbi:MAG: CotH kinase family protein [Treponema sp.]|nr:CotH kinase family protein [Treponema sp.]